MSSKKGRITRRAERKLRIKTMNTLHALKQAKRREEIIQRAMSDPCSISEVEAREIGLKKMEQIRAHRVNSLANVLGLNRS